MFANMRVIHFKNPLGPLPIQHSSFNVSLIDILFCRISQLINKMIIILDKTKDSQNSARQRKKISKFQNLVIIIDS